MSSLLITFTVVGVIVYLGIALGYFTAAKGRKNAARRESLGGMSEDRWLELHAQHLSSPRYRKEPTPSLRDFYAYDRIEGAEAVATVDYYRRALLCPVWPVLLVSDAITRYRQASEASAPYLLDQKRKQLLKAQEYSEQLAEAQREAQIAIDKARVSGSCTEQESVVD